MKHAVIGILAHVDAGKTTFAEALLYKTGTIRKAGKIETRDTLLDNHSLEKERGITIFASQAEFVYNDLSVTLLDTPGHVDFSAETERILQVLDYAVLIISGLDGVQSHTKTLWNLLRLYNIPTFIFVTKMDFARRSKDELMQSVTSELGDNCIDFTEANYDFYEKAAECSEKALDCFLEHNVITDDLLSEMIAKREIFPVMFGSGLKFDGITEFLDLIEKYTTPGVYSDEFGAKVFKVTHDSSGGKITHLKITGGVLKVRDSIKINEAYEKVSQIRIYNGLKFTSVDEVKSGTVCAVTGLDSTVNGMGLGAEVYTAAPVLEPVMNYRVVLPNGIDAQTVMTKLRSLEEEDPMLKVSWNSFLQEIHVGLMGEIQAEILKSLFADRFDINIDIDSGRVMYKETIASTVEGVGHYEPLRHYAEVHLLLEPLPTGTGIILDTAVKEDQLDRNWQRLIMMHLAEKEHIGVLTGSPITDIKITLAAGRAHLKHTEGGDFRQATYRAVRQGLMQTTSKLLEPWYEFTVEVPTEHMGRAINDIRMMHGNFENPINNGITAIIKGKAPVTEMNGYSSQVASYTSGKGRLFCTVAGYFECHNTADVLDNLKYDPEGDLDNTPDSVFCAHGGGFTVKWDKVYDYMHLESCIKKEKPYAPAINHRNLHIDDKELEAIMEREFGKVKYELHRPATSTSSPEKRSDSKLIERSECLIVDGYNVIFAWNDLKDLAMFDLEAARIKLMNILCNYSAFTKNRVILVFDAYRVAGNPGKKFDFNNIHVVFTKERELGDVYIEKLISDIGKNEKVRVVTSDNLIRLSAVRFGVLRVSAVEFEKEVDEVHQRIGDFIADLKNSN